MILGIKSQQEAVHREDSQTKMEIILKQRYVKMQDTTTRNIKEEQGNMTAADYKKSSSTDFSDTLKVSILHRQISSDPEVDSRGKWGKLIQDIEGETSNTEESHQTR